MALRFDCQGSAYNDINPELFLLKWLGVMALRVDCQGSACNDINPVLFYCNGLA